MRKCDQSKASQWYSYMLHTPEMFSFTTHTMFCIQYHFEHYLFIYSGGALVYTHKTKMLKGIWPQCVLLISFELICYPEKVNLLHIHDFEKISNTFFTPTAAPRSTSMSKKIFLLLFVDKFSVLVRNWIINYLV